MEKSEFRIYENKDVKIWLGKSGTDLTEEFKFIKDLIDIDLTEEKGEIVINEKKKN